MFDRITAQYIGSHYGFFVKAESINELKKMVLERCKPHTKDIDNFKKGARRANWDRIFEALQASKG